MIPSTAYSILCYDDPQNGTDPYCTRETISMVREWCDPRQVHIRSVSQQDLERYLDSDVRLFILPGGYSPLIGKSLVTLTENIRKRVFKGMNFYGSCAGAIVAGCYENYFERKYESNIFMKSFIESNIATFSNNYLQLYSDPIHAPFFPKEKKAPFCLKTIAVIDEINQNRFETPMWDGPFFSNVQNTNYSSLLTADVSPVAYTIQCHHNRKFDILPDPLVVHTHSIAVFREIPNTSSSIILTGNHLEFNPYTMEEELSKEYPKYKDYFHSTSNRLKPYDHIRIETIKNIFNKFQIPLLPTKNANS